MKALVQFGSFSKTKGGVLVIGLAELALALFLVNHAFDSGNWWEYLFATVCLVGFLQNSVSVIIGVLRHAR